MSWLRYAGLPGGRRGLGLATGERPDPRPALPVDAGPGPAPLTPRKERPRAPRPVVTRELSGESRARCYGFTPTRSQKEWFPGSLPAGARPRHRGRKNADRESDPRLPSLLQEGPAHSSCPLCGTGRALKVCPSLWQGPAWACPQPFPLRGPSTLSVGRGASHSEGALALGHPHTCHCDVPHPCHEHLLGMRPPTLSRTFSPRVPQAEGWGVLTRRDRPHPWHETRTSPHVCASSVSDGQCNELSAGHPGLLPSRP